MLSFLLLAWGSALKHVTPSDRIRRTVTLNPGQLLQLESEATKGDINILRINCTNFIMAISNHEKVSLNVGILDPSGKTWETETWYTIPDLEGFISFGPSRAIVEVVALEDVTFLAAGAVVEPTRTGSGCTEVRAGCNANDTFTSLPSTSLVCYVQTDPDTKGSINGYMDNVTVALFGAHVSTATYRGPDFKKYFGSYAQVIVIGPRANAYGTLTVSWNKAGVDYTYPTITSENAGNFVVHKKTGIVEPTVLESEPTYPATPVPTPTRSPVPSATKTDEKTNVAGSWALVAMAVGALLFVLGIAGIGVWLIYRNRASGYVMVNTVHNGTHAQPSPQVTTYRAPYQAPLPRHETNAPLLAPQDPGAVFPPPRGFGAQPPAPGNFGAQPQAPLNTSAPPAPRHDFGAQPQAPQAFAAPPPGPLNTSAPPPAPRDTGAPAPGDTSAPLL